MFEHQSYPVQSQVKFMIDMFSHPGTASLLYVNDAKVLIDILIDHTKQGEEGNEENFGKLAYHSKSILSLCYIA